jgi:hypothetical protein
MRYLAIIALLFATVARADETALIDLTTGEVLSYRTAEKPPANPNPVRWGKVTREPQPAYDPATHRIERVVTISPDKSSVAVTWQVIALTAEEIAARAAATADAADRTAKRTSVGQSVATLRQWATEARATTVTNTNDAAVTQTMVNRLAVFFDRFADLIHAQELDR